MPINIQDILKLTSSPDLVIQGGNSKITKVNADSNFYCVKDYSQRLDGKNRMTKEFNALTNLYPFNSTLFAQPIGYSEETLRAVYGWLEGERPALDNNSIEAILIIIRELKRLSCESESEIFDNATDFVFNFENIYQQLTQRYVEVIDENLIIPNDFFNEINIAMKKLLTFNELVGHPVRTLSVSDVGPHNLLIDGKRSEIHCVDLEFFGWDDAHKLFVDTLLHPNVYWNKKLIDYFYRNFMAIHPLVDERTIQFWKLLNLKWGFIILARYKRNKYELASESELNRILRLAQGYILRSMKEIQSVHDMLEESVLISKKI